MLPHHKRCMWRSHWKVRFLDFPRLRVERFWTSQTPWSDKKFETFFKKSIISCRRKKSESIRANQLQISLRVKKDFFYTFLYTLRWPTLRNEIISLQVIMGIQPPYRICPNILASSTRKVVFRRLKYLELEDRILGFEHKILWIE